MDNNKINILKEKIMTDYEFRYKCSKYNGVHWDSFNIFEDPHDGKMIIILDTPNKDVFVFMDEEYNTLGIHRFKDDEKRNFYNAVYDSRSIVEYISMCYNISINDISRLASRILLSESNHGHSLQMIINGEIVEFKGGEIYQNLLSYFAFLGSMIDNYYQKLYQATILNLEFPSITVYLYAVINNINNYIDECVNKNERPWPSGILECIGEKSDKIDYYINTLYLAITHLLYEKGLKIGSGNDYLKLIPLDFKKENIFNKTEELLHILDVPKDEVDERMREVRKTHNFNEISFTKLFPHNTKSR